MRLAICLIFLLTLFGINASEQKILDVGTSGFGKKMEMKSTLHVKSKSPTAEAVALIMLDGDNEREKFDVKALRKGVVLREEEGLSVITLKSSDFEADRGGHFNVTYLSNGLTKRYAKQELSIELMRNKWTVYYQGRVVKKLNFIIKKIFGKPVGIDRIDVQTAD